MFKCTSFDLEKDIFRVYDSDDEVTEECSEQEVREYLAGGAVIEDLPDLFTPKISKNRNLTKAKKAKNDEFYTQLSDIEKELSHYPIETFKDKVIYLPMDIAITDGNIKQSKFVTYFQMNAHKLQFKRLIATCLVEKTDGVGRNYYILNRQTVSYCTPENQASGKSPIAEVMREDGRLYYKYRMADNTPFHDYQINESEFRYIPIPDTTINQAVTDEDGAYTYKGASGAWDNQMYRFVDNLDAEEYCPSDKNWGSGDFRSKYCTRLLQEADIVVTNPPFSLFREFVKWLVDANKKFIVLGNSNAVTYKDVFKLIKDDKLWWGNTMNGGGQHWFLLPDNLDYNTGKIEIREDGHRYAMIGTVAWWTNCDFWKRHEKIIGLNKKDYESNGVSYYKYDNYDAIDVPRCNKIPVDYDGVIGVPITYLGIHNPDQFEIVNANDYRLRDTPEKSTMLIKDKEATITDNTGHTHTSYARICIRKRTS